METKHTPTPWYLGKDCAGCWCINDSDGAPGDRYEIASHLDKGNAELIVLAVNAYEKDQEIKKEMLGLLKESRNRMIGSAPAIRDLAKRTDEAIAKAEANS